MLLIRIRTRIIFILRLPSILVVVILQRPTLPGSLHHLNNLLDQLVILLLHLVRDITMIHPLPKLEWLDHPIDSSNTLPSMNLHFECIPHILPRLGDLPHLLRKRIQSNCLKQ
jgi:hypothetical protein